MPTNFSSTKDKHCFEGNGGLYLPTIGTGFKLKLAKASFEFWVWQQLYLAERLCYRRSLTK